MAHNVAINVAVNGESYAREVEARRTLADFLRDDLNLTGTHLGCEHGVCGNCTVLMNGETVRACLLFAVQADGQEIMTVEGLSQNGDFHPLQQAFWDHHGLQCGFCTPAMLMIAYEYLENRPDVGSDEEIREAISGVLCRCTGYQNIITSIRAAGEQIKVSADASTPMDKSVVS